MNKAGFSLVEVLIAVLIVFILAAQGLHHYMLAAECARVDAACATLRTIWVAERLYRMEHTTFDADLADLSSRGLVDARLAEQDDPFAFVIEHADASGFVAHAHRRETGSWNGTITIDATGALHGGVDGSGGQHVSPPVP